MAALVPCSLIGRHCLRLIPPTRVGEPVTDAKLFDESFPLKAGLAFEAESVLVGPLGDGLISADGKARHRRLASRFQTDGVEVWLVEDCLTWAAEAIAVEVASKSGSNGGAELRRVPPCQCSLPNPFALMMHEAAQALVGGEALTR